jgi:hypothetical protein
MSQNAQSTHFTDRLPFNPGRLLFITDRLLIITITTTLLIIIDRLVLRRQQLQAAQYQHLQLPRHQQLQAPLHQRLLALSRHQPVQVNPISLPKKEDSDLLASHAPFSGFDSGNESENPASAGPVKKRRGFKRGFKTSFITPTATVEKRAPVPTAAPKPKFGRSFFFKRGI